MHILRAVFFILIATPATAYIGPGAGLGTLGILLAIVLGIVLLLVGFVWFPLKRALRRRKERTANTSEHSPD